MHQNLKCRGNIGGKITLGGGKLSSFRWTFAFWKLSGDLHLIRWVVVVQLLSQVQLFATPWTAAGQASLSFTISQSLLKFMSIESEMPFNHLVLCHHFLLLASVFLSSIQSFAPFPIWNQSFVPYPVLTVASWPASRFLRRQDRWYGIPNCFRIFQFIMIHTIKGFGVVNKAEIDIFLELSCFFGDLMI